VENEKQKLGGISADCRRDAAAISSWHENLPASVGHPAGQGLRSPAAPAFAQNSEGRELFLSN
jgi:hypothetical protein